MNKFRTHKCDELRKEKVGEEVTLSGWINKKRDHGNLLFIDLRDNYGITQCIIDKENSNFKKLEKIQLETVIKIVGHVASPMPIWLKEKWVEWLGPGRVYELYGGTEGTGATWMSGHEWLEHKGSVGKLINGSRARILDENGEECAPGVVGEVYLMPQDGPGTSYHYVGAEPRVTANGWDSLGDMGWMDEDGYLYLIGRFKELINRSGEKISPFEVLGNS